MVLKIFAPLSPLPIGHCFYSFLDGGSADPQISAFILCAAVFEAKPCCGVYVLYTRCVALCCAALHEALKNAPKKRDSSDKTEQRKEHRRFWQKLEATRACNRESARPTGTLEPDSSRPESDACDARELWCFAGSFCWLSLSPILPPIARATRRGRRVHVPNVPLGRLRRVRILGRVLEFMPVDTSERL